MDPLLLRAGLLLQAFLCFLEAGFQFLQVLMFSLNLVCCFQILSATLCGHANNKLPSRSKVMLQFLETKAFLGAGVMLGITILLLLSRFSRVRLCATPQTAAHQAPPSLGFSRQEHWSGLPFPPPMHESEKEYICCQKISQVFL